MTKSVFLRIAHYLVIIVVSSGLAIQAANVYASYSSAGTENGLRLSGLRAMTEEQLRETVDSNHLLVYWAGPEKGAKYLLNAMEANVIVLTVLPQGADVTQTRASYPQIATYKQNDAFAAVLSGGENSGVRGLINADGNSVFYTGQDPKNIFVGLRGLDVELQIFDPSPGMSLSVAMLPGRLIPIAKAHG